MATYKGIQGFGVETLASDPTEPGSVGQIFYNSTEGVFKTVKPGGVSAGTWASGGPMNTARAQISGAGTKDAALVFSGSVPPVSALTESYNGSSWTEVNDLNTARRSGWWFWNTNSCNNGLWWFQIL
jgi:hypothetical protein